MSHTLVAMVTGDVMVPIGVDSECVLCEVHTEAEERNFIVETECLFREI